MQDLLEEPDDAEQLLKDICEEGGHIYVCGDVLMADQVCHTIQVGVQRPYTHRLQGACTLYGLRLSSS